MTCELTLDGHLSVGGDGCGCTSGEGMSQTVRGLSLSCRHATFQAIKSTDCAVQLSTAGVAGDNWAELPVTLSRYELLSLKSSAAIKVRIGAAPATKLGSGASFPANLDGLTFAFTVDGSAVSFAFAGTALTAAQAAAQINAAAIADGLDYLPAAVDPSGQVRLSGKATGVQGSLQVTTGQALLGLATMSAAEKGAGADLDVWGALLLQFGTSGPSRIQLSGSAKIEMLAAGTP